MKEHRPKWIKFKTVIDSGACTSVTNSDLFPGVPVRESKAKKEGVVYNGIGGEEIPNAGEIHVNVCAKDGALKRSRWQVAKGVARTLTATHDICKQGNWVLHDEHGGWIIDKHTGETTEFGVNDGVYEMELWAQVFPGQE